MTKCEKLDEMQRYCMMQFLKFRSSGNNLTAQIWANALKGYQKKIELLTVQEAGESNEL